MSNGNGKPANTKKARGVKRDENGHWVKGTASPNPAGRPPLGDSYKEILTAVGNLTIEELKERYPVYAKRFPGVPDDVHLKDLVALSVLVGLAIEPTPGLLGTLLDYTDGPPERRLKISGMSDDEVAEYVRTVLERVGIRLEPPSGKGLDSQADSPNSSVMESAPNADSTFG